MNIPRDECISYLNSQGFCMDVGVPTKKAEAVVICLLDWNKQNVNPDPSSEVSMDTLVKTAEEDSGNSDGKEEESDVEFESSSEESEEEVLPPLKKGDKLKVVKGFTTPYRLYQSNFRQGLILTVLKSADEEGDILVHHSTFGAERYLDENSVKKCERIVQAPRVTYHGFRKNKGDHPWEIVKRNLQAWLKSSKYSKSKKLVILVQTGSLNPIHKGHVGALEAAKAELESKKYNKKVLAGFLSPSDESWCGSKVHGCYRNEDRFNMVKMHVKGSDWIAADPWEIHQNEGKDFPEVLEDVQKKKACMIKGVEIEVIYICGTDHATKCGLWRGGYSYGVAVMKRPGYKTKKGRKGKGVYVVGSKTDFNASSTEIREAAVTNTLQDVEHKLHPKVFDALVKQKFLLPCQEEDDEDQDMWTNNYLNYSSHYNW